MYFLRKSMKERIAQDARKNGRLSPNAIHGKADRTAYYALRNLDRQKTIDGRYL
jgi:hypothetical protein